MRVLFRGVGQYAAAQCLCYLVGCNMIELIIIEDNAHMAEYVAAVIADAPDMKTLGIFATLTEALKAKLPVPPTMIILDLKLPDVKGTEAIGALQAKYPESRIVMYTAYENEFDILQCMLAGAAAYTLKDTPNHRLLDELRVVAQGGSTLTPRVAQKLIKHLSPETAVESPLSTRELEVLNFISLGLKYEDIADEMDISAHTVRHHIEKIFKKLNVNSRGQAVAQAVRQGIIKLD